MPDEPDMPVRRRWSIAVAVSFLIVLTDQIAKANASHVRAAALFPARNGGFATGWAPVSRAGVMIITAAVLASFVGIVGR
jgi:hypothetical protein